MRKINRFFLIPQKKLIPQTVKHEDRSLVFIYTTDGTSN